MRPASVRNWVILVTLKKQVHLIQFFIIKNIQFNVTMKRSLFLRRQKNIC